MCFVGRLAQHDPWAQRCVDQQRQQPQRDEQPGVSPGQRCRVHVAREAFPHRAVDRAPETQRQQGQESDPPDQRDQSARRSRIPLDQDANRQQAGRRGQHDAAAAPQQRSEFMLRKGCDAAHP